MRTLAALAAVLAAAMIWSADANAAEAYTVDPVQRVMVVETPANVRTGPGPDYDVHIALNEGVSVRVTGAVRDRDWLRIDLRGDGGEAFIYAPLLKEAPAPQLKPAPQLTETAEPAPLQPLGSDWSIAENQPCQVWNGGMGHKHEHYNWSGDCFGGKASGQGRLVWRTLFGKYVYEGFLLAGKRHGSGILKRSDGSRYEGQWRNGRRHGSGTYTWAVGHRYEGAWSDDKPHGFGTATFADGDVHRGEWRNGCYGERDGIWSALIATVEDCGFN